jgi:fructokinase
MRETNSETVMQTLVQAVLEKLGKGGRVLLAIAGPPASGKSTVSATLQARLTHDGVRAVVVPMDGFHLDNRVLDERGLRAKKGAPETFDVDGFAAVLRQLRATDRTIYLPVFDREKDLSIAAARVVEPETDVVIVEGNYLLFDEPAWRSMPDLWDLSLWIDTPPSVVRQRCIQRWLDHDHTPEAARARAEGNDLVNAERIRLARLPADVVLSDPADISE